VPGTNFQISFSEVLLGYLLIILVYVRLKRRGLFKEFATVAYLLYLKVRYLYFRSRLMHR